MDAGAQLDRTQSVLRFIAVGMVAAVPLSCSRASCISRWCSPTRCTAGGRYERAG